MRFAHSGMTINDVGCRAGTWKAREDPPLHYEIQSLGCYWLHYGPVMAPREGVEPPLFGIEIRCLFHLDHQGIGAHGKITRRIPAPRPKGPSLTRRSALLLQCWSNRLPLS